jgi:hypothetical protein
MKLFESLKKGFLCEKGKISTEKKRKIYLRKSLKRIIVNIFAIANSPIKLQIIFF